MREAFIEILNMSITGGYVILFVLLVRLLLKRMPKALSYMLWAVPFLRLILPFSIESSFSLVPMAAKPISQGILLAPIPKINSNIPAIDNAINSILPAPAIGASMNPLQLITFIAGIVWLVGAAALMIYGITSFIRLSRSLKGATHESGNIYIADNLRTPFVMGLIKPKIYLPNVLGGEERQYVLLHEHIHIKRLDYVWRLISFMALCLHWFNPLVWIAYIMTNRDMEFSCDEAVIKMLGSNIKKEYSSSLLYMASGMKLRLGMPIAFDDGNVKGRVKNVLNYKKPAFWMIIVAVLAVVIVGIGLLCSPKNRRLKYNTAMGDGPTAIFMAGEGGKAKMSGVNARVLEVDVANMVLSVEDIDGNGVLGDRCNVNCKEAVLVKIINEQPEEMSIAELAVGDEIILAIGDVEESYPTRTMAYFVQLSSHAWDRRPMMRINGKLYYLISFPEKVNVDPSKLEEIGEISSNVPQSEIPSDNMQSNENILGAKIYEYGDNVIAKINGVYCLYGQLNGDGSAISNAFSPEIIKHILAAFPADCTPEQGEEDGLFVTVHGKVKGDTKRIIDTFLAHVEKKEPSQIIIMQHTVEGDPIFTHIVHDGSVFQVVEDASRDKLGGESTKTPYVTVGKYLRTFNNEAMTYIYLTDSADVTLEYAQSGSTEYGLCRLIVGYES
ncbi:MAG: M56 family metallopeptidase [Clostridia bacterium]